MTGPEVARKPTPISRARIPASVVLPRPGRAVEQHVVERLAAAFRGMNEHAQILARGLLADELVEALRAQRLIGVLGGALGRGDSGGISRHRPLESSRSSQSYARARTCTRVVAPARSVLMPDAATRG